MENIIVHHVTKFDKNPLKINEVMANNVNGVRLLGNPLYNIDLAFTSTHHRSYYDLINETSTYPKSCHFNGTISFWRIIELFLLTCSSVE